MRDHVLVGFILAAALIQHVSVHRDIPNSDDQEGSESFTASLGMTRKVGSTS